MQLLNYWSWNNMGLKVKLMTGKDPNNRRLVEVHIFELIEWSDYYTKELKIFYALVDEVNFDVNNFQLQLYKDFNKVLF
jgi:hypothetical protein